jgi:tripeptide aminopeptidase
LTTKNIKSVYKDLPKIKKSLKGMSEILLANLVMVGEIPAPTFREERRVQFILDRFKEAGLTECSTDEAGNGIGLLPGTEGEHSILDQCSCRYCIQRKS